MQIDLFRVLWMKNKIAIIGASYLQLPIIECAKEYGLETHVFAWKMGAEGETVADFFYPISIIEKEKILARCQEIGISGVCSIASDLANITVNYVAEKMGLVGNGISSTEKCTNKHLMRQCFENNHLPSPRSILVDSDTELEKIEINYPAIVKPTDRSGSRGVYKLDSKDGLDERVRHAIELSYEKKALIESFIEGREYSVEYISYRGEHHFLALTDKYTTGAPSFIERGQFEPAIMSAEMLKSIKVLIEHALDVLGVSNGASHNEIKIDPQGRIWIIEIGARMGGDLIGSHLVKESTGIDMVKAVLQICLGERPDLKKIGECKTAGIRYIFDNSDLEVFSSVRKNNPEILLQSDVLEDMFLNGYGDNTISDSSKRLGYFLMSSQDHDLVKNYMPSRVN